MSDYSILKRLRGLVEFSYDQEDNLFDVLDSDALLHEQLSAEEMIRLSQEIAELAQKAKQEQNDA